MLTLDGKTYQVPGAYGTVEVIQLGSVALPLFNVLLLAGTARKGIPYNASIGGVTKKGYEVIQPFSSRISAEDFYGVSELTKGIEYAKKGGAGVIFAVNLASLTLALATIQDNAGSPLDAFNIHPTDKFWGAAGNDIAITIVTASGNVTYTLLPPKLTKFLTANASTTSKEIKLEDVDGLAVGQSIYLLSNVTVSPQLTTISVIDSVNNIITVADLPASAFATAEYARIYQEDLDKQQVQTFVVADSTVQDIIDWINSGTILVAERSTLTGAIPGTLTKTLIQNITGATKGTSPIATETTGGDYDDFAELVPQLFEEFENFYKFRIRIVNVLSKTAAVHSVYKTLALTVRNLQKSIQVVLGVDSGDIDLAESNTGHPIQRAKVLNSQDVVLVGSGIDDKAAYISSSPLFAGMISANSVKRNFTWDIINATKVEKFFGESNRDSTTVKYVNNGVIVFGTKSDGFYVVQGLNTYQNHALIWNEQDDATYLIQQRQIVDYVFEGYKKEMELGVGADGFSVTQASVKGLSILDKYLADGFILNRTMLNAYRQGNAVITNPKIKPLDATDFVGFILSVEVEG